MIIIAPCLPRGLLSCLADALSLSLSLSLCLKQQQPKENHLRLVFSFPLEPVSCVRPQGNGPQALAQGMLVSLMNRYGVRLKNVLF